MASMTQRTEDLYRLIANLLRIGVVFDVDLVAVRVRVFSGDLESDWLPWFELRAGTTTTWNPPTLGEQVIMLCPGGDLTAGIVLTGLNSEAIPAPSASADEHVTQYPDGARTVYDHVAGAMTITGIKTLRIEAADKIVFDCPLSVFLGKVVIEDLLTYLAGLAGQNGKGNTTAISGDLRHHSGQLSSNGVVLDIHDHGGVLRGDSRTDPPGVRP